MHSTTTSSPFDLGVRKSPGVVAESLVARLHRRAAEAGLFWDSRLEIKVNRDGGAQVRMVEGVVGVPARVVSDR